MITFEAWPKTPRLSAKDACSITEKIDGTNAAVIIDQFVVPEDGDEYGTHDPQGKRVMLDSPGYPTLNGRVGYLVGAQSRKKLITPGKQTDNAGFAGWVWENAEELIKLLGPGRHFGEWWGLGIQRGYGMSHKVFSLFNTHKWHSIASQRANWWSDARNIQMDTVPLLHLGKFSDLAVAQTLDDLRRNGSYAAAAWGAGRNQKAEGVVIHHRAFGGNLKAFIENDEIPKGAQE